MKPFVELCSLHVDDRGSVYCPLDQIGTGSFLRSGTGHLQIRRTYIVQNWDKGRVRAWHGHMRHWTGMHVVHGAAKLVARPIDIEMFEDLEEEFETVSVTLSDKNPGILWVPPGYYNGSVSLVDNTKILVYSTATFDEVKSDDIRSTVTRSDMLHHFGVEIR